MNSIFCKTLILVSAIFLCLPGSYGNELDDFEDDATLNRDTEQSGRVIDICDFEIDCEKYGIWDNIFTDVFSDVFGVVTDALILEGSRNTLARTSTASVKSSGGVLPRHPGNPLLPLFRADVNKQLVSGGIIGDDVRVEIGKSLVAGQARTTVFKKRFPPDSMRVTSLHGLYRLSYGNTVGVNLGLGIANLSGNESTTGFSLTTPFFWHFHKNFGIEYKPVFSGFNGTNVFDSDVNLMYHYHAASVVLGYRDISSQEDSLSGIYFGLSIRK